MNFYITHTLAPNVPVVTQTPSSPLTFSAVAGSLSAPAVGAATSGSSASRHDEYASGDWFVFKKRRSGSRYVGMYNFLVALVSLRERGKRGLLSTRNPRADDQLPARADSRAALAPPSASVGGP